MRALIEDSRAVDSPYRIAAVVSDRASAAGLAVARELGVDAEALPPPAGMDRSGYESLLEKAIARRRPALIALAGFMRILSAPFVEAFSGRVLNVHPSLLPRHPGLHTHRRALAAGDAEHGATVHFVTPELDAGPAVIQARLRIDAQDDEERLAGRVLGLEHRIYPLAVRWFCSGRLALREGRAFLDGHPLTAPVQFDAELSAAAR
ncbi:MAG: phosphoribosylglycinamide formyltransferase [Gammaproteobacteria bacterium]|nr:phosphoribosylglycinamide formyltransferase [Gammaproteobacteria bacterium]